MLLKQKNRNFLYAVSTIIGTTIGAGIFGLPYVVAQSGFFPGIFLLIFLGTIMLLVCLIYGEITLRTKKKHRLVGYAKKYLGKNGKRTALFASLFFLYGSILAYIIISGQFLNSLLANYLGGSEFIYSLIAFAFASVGIYFGLRVIEKIEFLMTILLLAVMALIFARGLPFIQTSNLLTFDPSQSFLPFGVILFSIGAMSAIPELEHILKKDQKRIKEAIFFGTFIPKVLYIIFILVIVGVSGASTSKEAFLGFHAIIGNGVITIGLIFGILAISTSLLMIGVNLKEMFMYDYGVRKSLAWFMTCFFPLVIFILGMRDFIQVINFVGGIAGGLSGILVILIYLKILANPKIGDLEPAYQIKVPKIVLSVMILVFIIGIVYQLVY